MKPVVALCACLVTLCSATVHSYPDVLFSDWIAKRECGEWDNSLDTESQSDISKDKCLEKCEGWNTGAGGCCWYRSDKDKCRWYDASDGNIQFAYRSDGDSKAMMLNGSSTVVGNFSWGLKVWFGSVHGVYVSSGDHATSYNSLGSLENCQEACLGDNLFMAEFYAKKDKCRCYGSSDEVSFAHEDSSYTLKYASAETSMLWRKFAFYSDVPGRTTWTYADNIQCKSGAPKLPPQGNALEMGLPECKELCLHAGKTHLYWYEWTGTDGHCQCCNALTTTPGTILGGAYTAYTAETSALMQTGGNLRKLDAMKKSRGGRLLKDKQQATLVKLRKRIKGAQNAGSTLSSD